MNDNPFMNDPLMYVVKLLALEEYYAERLGDPYLPGCSYQCDDCEYMDDCEWYWSYTNLDREFEPVKDE